MSPLLRSLLAMDKTKQYRVESVKVMHRVRIIEDYTMKTKSSNTIS